MKLLIVLFAVTACVVAQKEKCTDKEFKIYKDWQSKFNRPVEEDKAVEAQKCLNLIKAIAHIEKHNAEHPTKHKLAINHFGDLSPEDSKSRLGGKKPDDYVHTENDSGAGRKKRGTYPATRDWRKENLVSSVKFQGDCADCWSFVTVGAIEGAYAKKTGELVELSPQMLVDCVKDAKGCNTGWQYDAYKYVKKFGGISTEKSYPYVSGTSGAANPTCAAEKSEIGAKITGYKNIPSYDKEALMEAVGNVGPVAVSMDGEGLIFQFYQGGIYVNPDCKDTGPDSHSHAMLIVGYDTDTTNSTGLGDVPYWIVKNQYGDWWGDKGYMLMARDKSPQIPGCGIEQYASYVTV